MTSPYYVVQHLFPWHEDWTGGDVFYATLEQAREAAQMKAKWADQVKTRIVRVESVCSVVEEFTQQELPK